MADQWEWWRRALAAVEVHEVMPPIFADEPMSGFYETRSKNKATGEITRGIVAYWYDPEGYEKAGAKAHLYCKVGAGDSAKMLDDLIARERWPYASKRPIAKDLYYAVAKGGAWPNEHEAAARDRAREFSNSEQAAAEADSYEGIKDRIEDLAREAEALIKAGAAQTQEESDRAADLADRLRKLETRADDMRDAEKKPHKEAADAVQRKWAPLVTRADDCKGRLKKVVVTPFLKSLEAKQEAERSAAIKSGAPAETVTAMKAHAGTTTTAALRTVTSAIVEDWSKALAYFADNAKVRDLIQQLANAAARQGTCPDGCKIHTDKAAA